MSTSPRHHLLPIVILLLLLSPWGRAYGQPAQWDWARGFDTGSNEQVHDLVADPATNSVYLVGTYAASGMMGLPAPAGGNDAFLARYDLNGVLLWSRRIGGTGDDYGYGVALSPDGKVYVVGMTTSSALTVTLPILGTIPLLGSGAGNSDGFIAAFDASGSTLWSRLMGGTDSDLAWSVAANASGVFVQGTMRGTGSFGTLTATANLAGHDEIFLARFPLSGTSATWVITGGGAEDDLAERIAADGDGVAIIGSLRSNSFVWHSSGGAALTSVACTGSTDNGYVARVLNSGTIAWTRLIDAPNTHGNTFNGIAMGPGRVYITGRTHQGTIFPALGAVNHSGAHDYAFLASLDIANGDGQWVRTMRSTVQHGAEGFDLAVGANGMVYLSGSFTTSLSSDDGASLTGQDNSEIFLARFSPSGWRNWWLNESAPGDDYPVAIGTHPSGHVLVGGRYRDDLNLGSIAFTGGSSRNAFIGRLTDSAWALLLDQPARWKVLPPQCQTGPTIDLNSRLRGHADSWSASVSVTNPDNALFAPNGLAATFNGGGSRLVLDLGDTAIAGSGITLRHRLQTTGMNSRLSIQFSLDGTAWTDLGSNPIISNDAFADLSFSVPIDFRFLRVGITAAPPNAPWQLDAVTFLNGTMTGGTWSGPGTTAAGIFNPAGLSGWQPITYTVSTGTSTASHTRMIWVGAPPTGTITGISPVCPGTDQLLTINGMAPYTSVVNWAISADGMFWGLDMDSSATYATGALSATHHFQARLFSRGCGYAQTPILTVLVADTEPPVFSNCPGVIDITTDPGQCTAHYIMPILLSDDDCDTDTEEGFLTLWQAPGASTWVDISSQWSLNLPTGINRFSERHTDDAGNAAWCDWIVNVADGQPMSVTCPPGAITLSASAGCAAVMPDLTGTATVSDNCPGPYLVSQSIPVGAPLPLGGHLVLLIAQANGDSAACARAIDVVDSSGPSIACPGSVPALTVGADCTVALPDYTGLAVASDNCPASLTVSQSPAPGTFVSPGTHLIALTATSSGQSTTCSFAVQAIDNTPPSFPGPSLGLIAFTTAGTCTVSAPGYDAPQDDCSGVTVEHLSGPLPGTPLAPGSYSMVYRAVDASLNASAPRSMTIIVADTTAPVISGLPPSLSLANAPGSCSATVPDLLATASAFDACGVATFTQSPPAGASISGTFTVAVTATDAHGNQRTVIIPGTVSDAEPPAIACPPSLDLPADGGTCSAVATWGVPVTTDNCPGVAIVQTAGQPNGSAFPIGTHTITYVATDAAGLTATCSFQVIVSDQDAPTVICPLYDDYPLLLSGPGCTLAFPDLRDSLTVSDCSAWTNTMNPAPGTVFTHDTLVQMTMWIEDEHGNGIWNNHTIRIYGQTSDTTTVSSCDSYTWAVNGQTYTASGTYTALVGCVTEVLNLTITPSSTNTTSASACDSYTWSVNGQTYTASGTYTAVVGCVTEVLNLTITPSSTNTTSASSCDSYTWAVNGQTYTASGTYTALVGCVTEVLNLTITPSSSNTTTAASCDSYTWAVNGQTYTASGTYTAVVGCVTEVLNLTITPSSSNTTTVSYCDSYTWAVNGQTYTASGTYTAVVGCVTEVLNLTITPSSTNTTSASSCDSYTWAVNGQTYTASGTYTALVGCVTEVLNLTITPSSSNTTTAASCDSYTWAVNGQTYTASGTYTAVVGCVTEVLNLTITPSSSNTTTVSYCDSYTWAVNGQTYTASGTYTALVGCVTEVLNLTITPSSTNTTSASACDSYTWAVNGQTYTASGTYTAVVGCVTEVLNLTITPSSTNTTSASSCDSYTWAVNGQTYTASGTYTAVVGCVTEVLNLSIMMPGDACDDGDANTGNDVLDASCNCVGLPIDCAGIAGGTAFLDNCGNCVGGTTGSTACTQDCAGVWGGTAFIDNCNNCVGGTTGSMACTQDCAGVWGGTAQPGTPCDDGNSNTINDTWSTTCSCSGLAIDCTSEAGADQQVCGNTATLAAVGAGVWSGPPEVSFSSATAPDAIVTTSQLGAYDLIWTVTFGECVGIDTVRITFLASGDASFAYAQSVYCQDDASPTPWTAQNGGIFSASPAGLVLDPSTGAIDPGTSQPGNYVITYAIGGACPAIAEESVSIAASADASWAPPAAICASASPIDLSSLVSGTPGGSWSGPGVNGSFFNPNGLLGQVAITYAVTIGSCSAQLTQGIQVSEAIVADAGPDITVCGLSANMQATATNGISVWHLPNGVLLYGSSSDPMATMQATVYGSYPLIWSATSTACTSVDTAWVTFIEPMAGLWVDAGPDQSLAVTDATMLSGDASPGTQLTWWILDGSGSIASPNDSVTAISGLGLGSNIVVLTATGNQCSSVSDTVVIRVDDLFIPEGYSPNGDGVNDRWEIEGIEALPARVDVFNRWGKVVFSAERYANGWDGRGNNGHALPDDTYFYVLNLEGRGTYNGHVIIKR